MAASDKKSRFIAVLREIFSDGTTLSSKRVFGAIGFVAFIVIICVKIDNETAQTLGIISASLLGLGTFENIMSYFKKK
jgi:hypothetical protein